jgi:hypothetical protein
MCSLRDKDGGWPKKAGRSEESEYCPQGGDLQLQVNVTVHGNRKVIVCASWPNKVMRARLLPAAVMEIICAVFGARQRK